MSKVVSVPKFLKLQLQTLKLQTLKIRLLLGACLFPLGCGSSNEAVEIPPIKEQIQAVRDDPKIPPQAKEQIIKNLQKSPGASGQS